MCSVPKTLDQDAVGQRHLSSRANDGHRSGVCAVPPGLRPRAPGTRRASCSGARCCSNLLHCQSLHPPARAHARAVTSFVSSIRRTQPVCHASGSCALTAALSLAPRPTPVRTHRHRFRLLRFRGTGSQPTITHSPTLFGVARKEIPCSTRLSVPLSHTAHAHARPHAPPPPSRPLAWPLPSAIDRHRVIRRGRAVGDVSVARCPDRVGLR